MAVQYEKVLSEVKIQHSLFNGLLCKPSCVTEVRSSISKRNGLDYVSDQTSLRPNFSPNIINQSSVRLCCQDLESERQTFSHYSVQDLTRYLVHFIAWQEEQEPRRPSHALADSFCQISFTWVSALWRIAIYCVCNLLLLFPFESSLQSPTNMGGQDSDSHQSCSGEGYFR
jgi:hypothetical protein